MRPVVPQAAAPQGELVLNQPLAGLREFELTVVHGPFLRESLGHEVATEMLIWGNVDLGCNEKIQDTEANSRWLPYISHRQLVLSAGPGQKTINVKLRNDHGTSAALLGPRGDPVPKLVVGNEPHASLLWTCYKRGETLTAWSPSHACTQTWFGLHTNNEDSYPDRVDTPPLGAKGALAAGQWIEFALPSTLVDATHRVLILNIYVNSVWY